VIATRSSKKRMSWRMAVQLRFSFLCGSRGYHEYRTIWSPNVYEVLSVEHEASNTYDQYAIALKKRLPGRITNSVVGHLPKELSRFVRFIILHGASASAKVVDTHYRRSPLVQGGLEIPIEVTVEISNCEKNELAIQELVTEKYKEPVNERFEDATSTILARLRGNEDDSGSSDEDFDV
jgi:hypothetical protein